MASTKILLAEDDGFARFVITSVLKKQGFTVVNAEDGLQAFELFKTHPEIELIVTDLNMPKMNGVQLIKELRSSGTKVPIIVLSGNEDLSIAIGALKSGANDYILKEQHVKDTLILTVESLLEKERLRKQRNEALRQLNEELAEAAQYVKTLLPKPINTGVVRADWRFIPSTSLGGDAFGYQWLDDDYFVMYLLDVTGHGIGSALLSVTVMNVMRAGSLLSSDLHKPSKVLASLNQAFQMEEHNNLFYSIWYGVYHKPTRTLTYAEGGHPPALLIEYDNPKQIIQLSTPPNPVVGVMPDIPYEEKSITLQKKTGLYIYSDGVFEINQKDDTIWTFEEFIELMSSAPDSNRSLMDHLYDHTKSICKTDVFDDDFSILEITFDL